MSIQELSFAISKKPKFGPKALAAAVACAMACLGQLSCVVTDKIEFEDKINYPPEVTHYTPSGSIISVCSDDESVFIVHVWEPDEDNLDSLEMEGRLILDLDPSAVYKKCRSPKELENASAQEEIGMVVLIECRIDLGQYNVVENSLIPIQLQISDLGFTNADNVQTGANTVDLTWTFKVEECD